MQIKEMRRKAKLQRNLIRTLTVVSAMMIATIIVLGFSLFGFNSKFKKLSKEYDSLQTSSTRESFQNKVNIIELQSTIEDLNKQLQHVSNVNHSYVDELNKLRARKELYNKYEYAVLDEEGKRTNLTYEEIELGEQLMKEKGYDPHLMFGTIMVESNGNPNDVNSQSGATGYGQFLDETARFTWITLMDNKSYHSDIRKDGTSNIKMMASYYDYLYNKFGNTFGVIKSYSGNSTDSGAQRYLNRINKYTTKVGAVVD